jgi:hypothetical protein
MSSPSVEQQVPRDVCNALDHGLTGNGHTNDQPALAQLVDRLGRAAADDGRGRVIYCPPGVYLLRDATTIWRSRVSLMGAGAGVTRFVLANPSNPREPMAVARFTEQQHGASRERHLADVMFAEFEIDGRRVNLEKYDPHAKGLDLQYMVRATFRDLYIHGTAGTGLGCDHLQDSVIEGIVAQDCGRLNGGDSPGGAGIGIGVGGWGPIERCSLNDCIATGNATNGIFVELQPGHEPAPRGIKITGGHCVGNRCGIADWGCEGLIVTACVMCENREAGFEVSARGTSQRGGQGGMLTDCLIDGNGQDGVRIGDTEGRYCVRGNRISNNAHFGYHQMNAKDPAPAHEISVEGNEIWGNGHGGICLGAPTVDASVVGNRIRRNGTRREGGAPGVSVVAATTSAWIRGNRIWPGADGQAGPTVWVGDAVPCTRCRIEDNGP